MRVLPSRRAMGLLAGLSLLVLLAAVSIGATSRSPFHMLHALLIEGLDMQERVVLFNIRLPRLALGLLAGGALAISGTLMQALFRNPLADPGVIGVAPGAALGAVSAIVLGGMVAPWLPFALGLPEMTILPAFLGGWATVALLSRIAFRAGSTDISSLLLAGIAMSALTGAATGLLITMADDQQLRDLTYWSMGSLAGATWSKVAMAAAVIVPVFALAPRLACGLNALSLGEQPAHHMGHRVERLKRFAILLTALATGAAVSMTGAIGFVGIIVPHMLRLLFGPDHRLILPASALMGGMLLVAADVLSRSLTAPAEIPIGILTALIGAPVFLHILLRRMRAQVA
ncbi:iron ABC transporter permease [Paracoccus sp. (in: a-proteobacteria)]|uniref:FecCD family ABC transporter permease n=1 Tax=Paracoccus sp. TaxID=267 RepID=UPI00322074A1